MQKKHAYLIMAHHRMDLLRELLFALDDPRCDIYVHIDKKCKENCPIQEMEHSKLFFLDGMDVRWAGYTQIECELYLLRTALANGDYAYLHLLTGVSFPIKNNEYIYSFFEANAGYEFVGFDHTADFSKRVKYVYLFNEMGKESTKADFRKEKLRRRFVLVQKLLRYDRFKNYKMDCQKGIAYWSITSGFANYLLTQEEKIHDIFQYSICGDEVFTQTVLYNSPFKDRIYDLSDEFKGSLRCMPWDSSIGERPGHNFDLNDFPYLESSPCLFALKFENDEGTALIQKIKKELLR